MVTTIARLLNITKIFHNHFLVLFQCFPILSDIFIIFLLDIRPFWLYIGNTMNDISQKINQDLLEYQTDRIRNLIEEMVGCCNDRKFYESNKFGLPYAEINCLILFNGERYLTVKVMAEKLDVAKSRVTKLVKGLMDKGLIDQIDDPRDGRSRLISLSSKGQRLSKQIEAFQKDIHRQLLLHMEPAERKNALTYLESLRSAMEAVKEELV